jgi:hypothetical protein
MGKFNASLIPNTPGDDVNMKDEDIALYAILPFGQLFMRIFKFNGSIDYSILWLCTLPSFIFLYNLLDIYSFTAAYFIKLTISFALMAGLGSVPGIFAKQKKIKKAEPGHLFSYTMILPLISRIVLVIGLAFALDYSDYDMKTVIMHTILFFILMFTNFLIINFEASECQNVNLDTLNTFLHVLMNTCAEYGIIFFFIGVAAKGRALAYDAYSAPVPLFGDVGEIIEAVLWIIGAIVAHVIIKMFHLTYNPDGICNTDGDLSDLRYVLSGITFLLGLIYYIGQSKYSYPTYYL